MVFLFDTHFDTQKTACFRKRKIVYFASTRLKIPVIPMKADQYAIPDIRKALENIEFSNPDIKRISMEQLEQAIRLTRTPAIYNIDNIIEKLRSYITKHAKHPEHLFVREKELCTIIGVNKLALHQWRKRGLIEFSRTGPRSILYSLRDLLGDFKNIREGNIPVRFDS